MKSFDDDNHTKKGKSCKTPREGRRREDRKVTTQGTQEDLRTGRVESGVTDSERIR